MAKESKEQQQTVARVMHEFAEGKLESSQGGRVRSPKQAIAIALSEAGASNRQTPEQNRRRLAKTKRRERSSSPTRAELYAEAAGKDIKGRSRMSKLELQRALER